MSPPPPSVTAMTSSNSTTLRKSPRKRVKSESSSVESEALPSEDYSSAPVHRMAKAPRFKTVLRPTGLHTIARLYLIVHNTTMLASWLNLFFWIGFHGVVNEGDLTGIHTITGKPVIWLQILALAELAHVVFGLYRSSTFSTGMQLASRLFISTICVEGAKVYYTTAYVMLVLAWGMADIIRYAYYTSYQVTDGWVPKWLVWLRYSAFIILYPLGTSAELWIMYLAWEAEFQPRGGVYNYGMICLMVTWLPGLVYLYTHMLRQRSKHLRN